MSVQQWHEFKVMIVRAKRIEERLSHLDPPYVEEELEEGKDWDVEVKAVSSVAHSRVEELLTQHRKEEEGVHSDGHHLRKHWGK